MKDPSKEETEWIQIIQCPEQRKTLESKILGGIPDSLRSLVWKLLLEPDLKQIGKLESVSHYYDMCEPAANKVILADIPRTIFFQSPQEEISNSLYRVLRAYHNYDPEIGYMSGMSFICGFLLKYMEEETAFRCFVSIMHGQHHNLRNLYKNMNNNYQIVSLVWTELLKIKFPTVHQKLVDFDMAKTLQAYDYTTALVIFLEKDFPLEIKSKIFDRYVLFGNRAVISFSLAIVEFNKNEFENITTQNSLFSFLFGGQLKTVLNDLGTLMDLYDKNMLTEEEYKSVFQVLNLEFIP